MPPSKATDAVNSIALLAIAASMSLRPDDEPAGGGCNVSCKGSPFGLCFRGITAVNGGNERDCTKGTRSIVMEVRAVKPSVTNCTCNLGLLMAASSVTAVDSAPDSLSNEIVKFTFTLAACSNVLRCAGNSFVTEIISTLLGATPPIAAIPLTKIAAVGASNVLVV